VNHSSIALKYLDLKHALLVKHFSDLFVHVSLDCVYTSGCASGTGILLVTFPAIFLVDLVIWSQAFESDSRTGRAAFTLVVTLHGVGAHRSNHPATDYKIMATPVTPVTRVIGSE